MGKILHVQLVPFFLYEDLLYLFMNKICAGCLFSGLDQASVFPAPGFSTLNHF